MATEPWAAERRSLRMRLVANVIGSCYPDRKSPFVLHRQKSIWADGGGRPPHFDIHFGCCRAVTFRPRDAIFEACLHAQANDRKTLTNLRSWSSIWRRGTPLCGQRMGRTQPLFYWESWEGLKAAPLALPAFLPKSGPRLRGRRPWHAGRNMTDPSLLETASEALASALDADVIFYNGGMVRGNDHRFIDMCRGRLKRRPNVLLILVTPGGDAHAAYRIARCLQRLYSKFSVFVPGWCKSAGTLVAIGAHELIMGDFGELGPIDVQRGKEDELFESSSGLTEDATLKALEKIAIKMFRDYVYDIKRMSKGQVTFGTAADVAAKMVSGQLTPIYGQIDPLKIGESARAMQIAVDYAFRLTLESQSMADRKSLDGLVSAYSSHGFVIDRKEAEELFRVVKEPDKLLEDICSALHGAWENSVYFPVQDDEDDPPIMKFLSKDPGDETQQPTTQSEPVSAFVNGGDSGRAVSTEEVSSSGNVAPFRPAGTEKEV